MQSRAVINIKDLQHMMAVIGMPEIPGIMVKAMDHPSTYYGEAHMESHTESHTESQPEFQTESQTETQTKSQPESQTEFHTEPHIDPHPSEDENHHTKAPEEKDHQDSVDDSLELILLSLAMIRASDYHLLIQPSDTFLYEYRIIYLAYEGILVVDKRHDTDHIRFTMVPYITLAIGSVSGIGVERPLVPMEMKKVAESQNLLVTEHSPAGDEIYKTICKVGEEPEAIERMSDFLVSAHRKCLLEAKKA